MLGPCGWVAGDSGGGEGGELRLALGEAVVGEAWVGTALDDAAPLEESQDTDAGGVQEICDVGVVERGELVEGELSVVCVDEDAVQGEQVQVGVQSEVRAHALHDGDGPALPFAYAMQVAHRAAVEAEHAVGEQPRDSPAELAVVGDASAQLEWEGEDPLPERR